jgi:hypothetical protein
VIRWGFRIADAGLVGFLVGLILIPWWPSGGVDVFLGGMALLIVAFVMLAWPRRTAR